MEVITKFSVMNVRFDNPVMGGLLTKKRISLNSAKCVAFGKEGSELLVDINILHFL